MPDLPAEQPRSHDVVRLETFVDAIAAIAITLLVLPLVDLASDLGDGSVRDLLTDHLSELEGFLLSFVIIARLWFAQHHVMRSVVGYERRVGVLLLLWSLTVVVLPFPTALVAEADDQAAAKCLYIGTMAASSAVLSMLAAVIARRPELRGGAPAPDYATSAGNAVAFVVALAVSLVWPAIGYLPLLLLALVDPAVARLRRWRTSGRAPRRVGD